MGPIASLTSKIRMRRCGFNTLPPGTVVGPISGKKFVLVWMEEGSCEVELEGETIEVGARVLVLCPPRVEITYRWTDKSRVMGYAFFYAEPELQLGTIFRLHDDDIVPPLLRHLLWLQLNQPINWVHRIDSALSFILELLASSHAGTNLEEAPPVAPPIQRVMEYVGRLWEHQKMPQPSLTVLAREAHVTPAHLTRLFTRHLGHPPLESLRYFRLSRAASLLRETQMPVRRVSELCGFSSEFHFSDTFKKWTSQAPSVFRASTVPPPEVPESLAPLARYLRGQIVEQIVPLH